MENIFWGLAGKTVSLIETVFTKNRVVRYIINGIYTLLFDGEQRKSRINWGYLSKIVSINRQAPRGYAS